MEIVQGDFVRNAAQHVPVAIAQGTKLATGSARVLMESHSLDRDEDFTLLHLQRMSEFVCNRTYCSQCSDTGRDQSGIHSSTLMTE